MSYKIVRAEIDHVLRIPLLLLDANGRHICISGDNGLGKTSAVTALANGITGFSAKDTPEIIHDGADKGRTTITLSDGSDVLTIERVFTPGQPTGRVTVTAKAGERLRDSSDLLKRLKCELAIHPLTFLEKRPQDQLDDLLAICRVPVPVDKVRQITGENHEAIPGESAYSYLMRLSADRTGVYFDRRREAHRVAMDKDAQVQEQRLELERLGGAPDAEASSAGDILARCKELQQQADARRLLADEVAEAKQTRARTASRIASIDADLKKQVQEEARLLRELERVRETMAELNKRLMMGREIADDDEAVLKVAEEHLLAAPDPSDELGRLREQLSSIERDNSRLAKRQQAAEHLERLVVAREGAMAVHKLMDDVMAALRHERLHLLDDVDIGIPGVSVGEGELLYNGVSFRQISRSQGIIVAFGLVRKQKPLAAILWLDNAESLGEKNRALMYQLANEAGMQVIETRVSSDTTLKVEFFDAEPGPSQPRGKKDATDGKMQRQGLLSTQA